MAALPVLLLALPSALPAVAAQPPEPQPMGELHENIAQYRQIAEDLSITIAQTEIIRRQIDLLQGQMDERRAKVGRLAAATYRSHHADPLYVLIDASSTGEVLERLLLLDAFARRRQAEIDALALTSARYDTAQRTLDSLIAQQRSQQQTLVQLRTKIQKVRH